MIEKAAGLWGKAGQRSLARSAFVEAAPQLTRALTQILALSLTSVLRRQQIKFQIALVYALLNTKGAVAAETIAALEQARFLIERAEALDEPPDYWQLFSVLNGFCIASFVAFNGSSMRERAAQLLALAQKQGAITSLIMGHRLMGMSLMWTGENAKGREHLDRAVSLHDHTKHPPTTGIDRDFWVYTLSDRSLVLWTLGFPEAALTDAERVLKDARDFGRGWAYALIMCSVVCIVCGNYGTVNAQLEEAIAWADERDAVFWKGSLTALKGWILTLTGKASEAVQMIKAGIAEYRSTSSTVGLPLQLCNLAIAYAVNNQFDDAWLCIDEAIVAIKATEETIFEAEVNRVAGVIALQAPEPDAAKAEAYFERALSVARQQQAKSWELRAAMSLARLWRDQSKVQQARELLTPVYGWFAEGFDTRDLKEAKALLEQLAA
jgi:tetratricopeptide (TPR) repeat protein